MHPSSLYVFGGLDSDPFPFTANPVLTEPFPSHFVRVLPDLYILFPHYCPCSFTLWGLIYSFTMSFTMLCSQELSQGDVIRKLDSVDKCWLNKIQYNFNVSFFKIKTQGVTLFLLTSKWCFISSSLYSIITLILT